jgi:carbonic anhydrase
MVFIDLTVDYAWGELRKAWIDVSSNWVVLRFMSDGFLRLEGTFLNNTDVHRVFRAEGIAEFHTPSEHRFHPNEELDVELEFLMKDKQGNKARVSVFFDRVVGGNTANDFIDGLSLGQPGYDNMDKVNTSIKALFEKLDNLNLYSYQGNIPYPPCNEPVDWFLFHDVQPISNA